MAAEFDCPDFPLQTFDSVLFSSHSEREGGFTQQQILGAENGVHQNKILR